MRCSGAWGGGKMQGTGLLKGLGVTIKRYFSPKVTQAYPEVKPNLPPLVKSRFLLEAEKCIACGICAKACPNKVITVGSRRDENKKRILTSYDMNLQYCLYCGLCVESCPTQAIIIDQDFELSVFNRESTKQELFREAEFDALDKGGPDNKETNQKGGEEV